MSEVDTSGQSAIAVEPASDAIQEEPSTSPSAESAAAPEEQKPKGVQKRLDELTRNWREEQRRSQFLEQQLLREQQLREQAAKPPEAEAPQGAPKVEDFQNYEDFVAAKARYEVRQELEAERQKERATTEQRQRESREQAFYAKAQEFAADHEDFNDIAFSNHFPVTDEMAQVMHESEIGPQMLYHLAKNPSEAVRIAQMSPLNAARELGRLEMRLAPQPKRNSNAPPPIDPVNGSGTPPAGDIYDPKLSDAQYYALREQQRKAKR